MKRRTFLQRAGLTLTAWGVGDRGLAAIAQRYQQAVAAPTLRKLALLVGINRYLSKPLNGCLTDVALQQELLMHRFGFLPSDILTLVDDQATQPQIVTAFTEHLGNQAKAGDVVVVHFSGYSRFSNPGTERTQTSLITADLPLSDDPSALLGLSIDTLDLLLRSLPTDQVTTILDTSPVYLGAALQGNLRVRAYPPLLMGELDAAELALQDQLLGHVGSDRSQQQSQHPREPIGISIAAAGVDQLALEAQWSGFSAGVFTYALTQQIWQATPSTSLQVCLKQTTEAISPLTDYNQKPSLGGQMSDRPLKPYLLPLLTATAEGVVTGIEESDKVGKLWLGGVAANVLEHYGVNSILTLESDPAQSLRIINREGLTARVRLLGEDASLQPGQLAQESVRLISRNISLNVALDTELAKIERIDATSAFSAVSRVALVAAGETADYLFGKVPQEVTQVAALPTATLAGLITPDTYGLFSQGKGTIANTTGDPGEAVKLAVRRLVPQLQTLLATKLLNLTANENSSRLGIRAIMEMVTTPAKFLTQRETLRSFSLNNQNLEPSTIIVEVSVGSRIQYRLQNLSNQPVYFLMLGLDTNGKAFYYAQPATADQPTDILAPQDTITLPPTAVMAEWIVRSPIGQAETHLICSRTPFQQTKALLPKSTDTTPTFRPLPNPLDIAQAVLQDLHQGEPSDVFALDVNTWATLRFVYRVV